MTTAAEIEAQAAEWLIRLDADPSPANRAAFEAWAAADPRRRAAFLRLEAGWRRADRLRNLRPLDGPVNEDLLDPQVVEDVVPEPHRSGWLRRLPLVAVLAVLAVAAGLWSLFTWTEWQVYETEPGGFQRIALQDGSIVHLNTDSEIRVRLDRERREVVLARGEALFTVARDPSRPFDVRAAGTLVRAIGTAFSVRVLDRKQVEVVVKEGRVAIRPPERLLDLKLSPPVAPPPLPTLSAGEAATVGAPDKELDVRKVDSEDVSRKLAWTDGRIWFDHTTLADAAAEFNRYNRRQIEIADPRIAEIRIGGGFDATDPDSFVAAVEQSFGLRSVRINPGDPNREIIRLLGPQGSKSH